MLIAAGNPATCELAFSEVCALNPRLPVNIDRGRAVEDQVRPEAPGVCNGPCNAIVSPGAVLYQKIFGRMAGKKPVG